MKFEDIPFYTRMSYPRKTRKGKTYKFGNVKKKNSNKILMELHKKNSLKDILEQLLVLYIVKVVIMWLETMVQRGV